LVYLTTFATCGGTSKHGKHHAEEMLDVVLNVQGKLPHDAARFPPAL